MKLEALWADRRTRYMREVLPYWRYVMSSGGMALGFAVILIIQGYASLLTRTREAAAADPALPLLASLFLALCLLWNPVRTYLARPDLIFLLPIEGRMNEYFRGAWRSGAAISGGLTALALALYWPLYEAAGMGSAESYAVSATCLLALKALMYYGAWKERQFRYRADRLAFGAAKAAAAAATGFGLLRGELTMISVLLLAVWAAYAVALRMPAAFRCHWEHLLEQEERTVSLHEAWFSLFVDLPHRAETYKPRAYLNGLLRWIRYRKESAFLYLSWRSFLRSALAVLAVRMIVLEAVIIWVFPNPWAAAAIYVLFCWLLGLQLRSIAVRPSEPLLAAMTPLPSSLRDRSQRTVQQLSYLTGVLLMAVPLAVVAPFPLAAGFALAGAASAILFARRRLNHIQ